ncbi:hypothetical protein LN042_07535 [Kitasatospora sp. RB6PN24]|uniref:hypothetical protein n=1 Tax=Kitasatospora humi TaxID=2893891 RepID=UPI001E4F16B1|nr:hypothetical protein [Kitasatospora humi]MCC9306959.1 hypothetical protein [Kitasatospora humi]
MPAATWLAGAAGSLRHDVVIAWGDEPGRPQPLPCGARWDVVRVPERIGSRVLGRLLTGDGQGAIGPVLLDRRARNLYWLVAIETEPIARWSTVLEVRFFSHGDYLAVPSPDVTDAWPADWVYWPEITGALTPPAMLAAAIGRELPGGAR